MVMPEAANTSDATACANRRRRRRSGAGILRGACAAVGALALLALAISIASPPALRAGDDPSADSPISEQGAAEDARFVAQTRRTLKKQHARVIALASLLLEKDAARNDLEDQLAVQPIKVESAKMRLESAVLAREIAELALAEYERSVSVLAKTTLNTELKAARDELERARPRVQVAKDRSSRIAKASKGTASDIADELRHSAAATIAELETRKAEFVLEQAESKLRVLVEYEQPKTIKELRASVEKAKADELGKKATWELEQGKLKQLTASSNEPQRIARARRVRPLVEQQLLDSINRAFPIEEQIRAKLGQITKGGKLHDRLRAEIQDLIQQLAALVDQAEIARSAATFDSLMSRIHRAAN
jgi:hypothetical protein